MEKLYKVSEIAEICTVTKPTVHNWINRGLLKVINLPFGRKKVSKENLNAFLTGAGMELVNIKQRLTESPVSQTEPIQ